MTALVDRPWLQEIPRTWPVRRVGAIGDVLVGRQRTPAHQKGEHLIPYLRVANVLDGYIAYSDVLVMNFKPREQRVFMLAPGDILLNEGQSLELVGRSALFNGDAATYCFQNTLIRFRAGADVEPRFARYVFKAWLDAGVFQIIARRATNIAHLGGERFASMPFALPPLVVQRTAANFLDAETARIDALIAAKENLLTILAEKRRAVITQAVTRGLDPSMPMRDSGIPWLGEIPVHWEVTRLKFLLDGIEQGWSPQCDNYPAGPNEWGVMKTGCVNGDTFDETKNKRLPDDLIPRPQYEIHDGDFLMSRANTTALVGSTAFVRRVRSRLMLCDKLYRLRLQGRRLDGAFLELFFNSPLGRYEFERDASGASASMQNISQDAVRNIWLAAPPRTEQSNIVDTTHQTLTHLDQVRRSAIHTVNLLRERREAVIAAAVTGQLDVGGM